MIKCLYHTHLRLLQAVAVELLALLQIPTGRRILNVLIFTLTAQAKGTGRRAGVILLSSRHPYSPSFGPVCWMLARSSLSAHMSGWGRGVRNDEIRQHIRQAVRDDRGPPLPRWTAAVCHPARAKCRCSVVWRRRKLAGALTSPDSR
jgi:hypothetical protein